MDPVLVIDVAHEAWRCVRESTTARPFASLLARIDALAAEHPRCILALDSPPYDRAAVLPSYKAHRTADPEARALVGAMLDGLRQSGRVIAEHPGAEADDVCATIAQWCHEHGVPCTIATSDKDHAPLLGIARVWDLRTGAEVTAETVRARWGVEPERLHSLLALCGDTSDGIAGVPGIGEKKAAALLGRVGDLWEILGMEPKTADEIEALAKAADKAQRAAKKAEDKRDPEAETLRALANEAAASLWISRHIAIVHQHRAAVEQARALVALRYDVPIDVAALLAVHEGEPDAPAIDHSVPPADPIVRALYEREEKTMQEPTTETVIEEAPAVRVAQPLALRPEPAPVAPAPPSQPRAVEPMPEPATRFRSSRQVGDLMRALAAAQGEIEFAVKDAVNNHTNKRYADLASVWKAIRLPLSKHGIAVVQVIVDGHLVTRLYCGEQWIEGETKLALDTATGRTPVQALGSAITYLRRYVLSSMVGVAPDDDDDGEGTRAIPAQRRTA